MRNISFAMTLEAFESRTKTVTRRPGWQFLKPGDLLMGVEKGMGLKKGEKVKKLAPICVVKVTREQLWCIKNYPESEMAKEGLPQMSAQEYIRMMCLAYKIDRGAMVTRIEFEYLKDEQL